MSAEDFEAIRLLIQQGHVELADKLYKQHKDAIIASNMCCKGSINTNNDSNRITISSSLTEKQMNRLINEPYFDS